MVCAEMLLRGSGSGRASGRHPPFVFLLQAAPAVPERQGLRAGETGDQYVEVRVPAGADAQQDGAVGHAAMDQGEQHVVATWLQFERDAAGVAPGDRELARRIELGDAAL